MKPIDTLVKLGIVEYVDHCGGAFWAVGDWITHDPDQILSNNDVMAAVMGKLRWKQGWMKWESGRHVDDGHDVVSVTAYLPASMSDPIVNENLTTAIILAGLQALEGE